MHLRGTKPRHAVWSLGILAALAASVLAQTASQGDGTGGTVITVNGKPANGNRSYSITKPGTFDEAHFKDADLRGVLRLLSVEGRRNIVASNDVSGRITADFYNVTFDEALDAIMRATGYVYEKRGNFYFVYTEEQLEEIRRNEQTVTRIFQLNFTRAADLDTMIRPLLSENGTLTMNPASEVGIETSGTEAGGDNYSGREVIIVRDLASVVDQIEKIIERIDVKPVQLLIEATMLRATLTEDNALGVDITDLGAITMPNLDTSINYNTALTSGVPTGGLSMTVTTGRAEFLVRALETVTDVAIMANPKLLVLNKQRGEVMIGNRDGYLTTTVTETSAVQTVEFLETGTRLVVRPFVGDDGYIRMEVHPEDSSGSVSQVGSSVLPSETTTEVTSNVIVKDGHTIVIGGLFRERTNISRSQVPVAGNVPILGSLFRRTGDSTQREEVIILITPHILEEKVAADMGQAMKSEILRQRIGLRKGLRWWGRNRLAQTHLNWARKYAANGNETLAIWNADLALSLEPRMADALHLKEKLTGKAVWAEFNKYSEVNHFLQRMMMHELGREVDVLVPPNRPRDLKTLDPAVRKKLGILGPDGSAAIPVPETRSLQDEEDQAAGGPVPQPGCPSPEELGLTEPVQGPSDTPAGIETWPLDESGDGPTETAEGPAPQDPGSDPVQGVDGPQEVADKPEPQAEWFDELVEDWDDDPRDTDPASDRQGPDATDVAGTRGPIRTIEPFVQVDLWRGVEDLLPETAPEKWWDQALETKPETVVGPVQPESPAEPKEDLVLEIEPIDESELDLIEPIDESELELIDEEQLED